MRKALSKKKATLEDVARAAGVGAMTVSRTINNHPYVADETAKRVRAAIRKLAYRPNHAARILTGQLSRSIGLIVPDLADPFFSAIGHAVQEAAREAGSLAWLAASNGDSALEQAQIEQMTNHPVDGILLVPADSQSEYLKSAAVGSIPIVTIDRSIEGVLTTSVEVENRAGAQMAIEHLIGHSCKRITCVVMSSTLQPIKQRIAGYEDCLRQAGFPSRRIVPLEETSAHKVLSTLFNSSDRPDALFTANNACTLLVIKTLRSLKVEVPKDVRLIGFDDEDLYTSLNPPVTTIGQPTAELGHTSLRLLLQKINRTFTASGTRTILPVTLIVRESCGCNRS